MIVAGGLARLPSLFCVLLFDLLLGYLLLIRVEVPSRLRFREFGRFMMSACSVMSRQDSFQLDEVSCFW